MKIVADENIPLLNHYFSEHELITLPGRKITTEVVKDADVLLVRSVTPVNAALLQLSKVKFVGSTTSGFDHLDTRWLDAQGIKWRYAKGCNAEAVCEYVLSVIAALQKKNLLPEKFRAAIVGVGEIGERVYKKFQELNIDTLLCDPFREDLLTVSLEEITHVDFISFHVPLTYDGPHPTYHLVNQKFLQRQKQHCVLVNASRGEVISFQDLKNDGLHLQWCLDVWEGEPLIDPVILEKAVIATPHIAGYSVESKYRGIEMIYEELYNTGILAGAKIPPISYPMEKIQLNGSEQNWQDTLLSVFDPFQTTDEMKKALFANPSAFDELRRQFSGRHELRYVEWK